MSSNTVLSSNPSRSNALAVVPRAPKRRKMGDDAYTSYTYGCDLEPANECRPGTPVVLPLAPKKGAKQSYTVLAD